MAHAAPTDVLIVKTVDLSVMDIQPGHGGVIDMDGRRMAVYRDPEGTVHSVSARCTHMGCTVGWNDGDKSFDCPCHGSRFRVDGSVLSGPAARPLEPLGAPAAPGDYGPARPEPVTSRRRGKDRFVIVGASLAGGSPRR